MGKISRLWRTFVVVPSGRTLAESAGVFVLIVGFVSAVLSLTPMARPTWASAIATLAGAAVVSFVYAVLRTQNTQLPGDFLPSYEDSALTLSVTTRPALIAQVNALAKDLYLGVTPIDTAQYAAWLKVNPNLLVCLLDRKDQVQGYFDVFPLEARFLASLIKGTVGESDIRVEHILPPDLARVAPRIYLAGAAVRDAESMRGKLRAGKLFNGVASYLEHYYGAPCDKELVVAGATPEGEKYLRDFGFTCEVEASARKDKSPLFIRKMDARLFAEISAAARERAGDCPLSWASPPKTPAAPRVRGSRRRSSSRSGRRATNRVE